MPVTQKARTTKTAAFVVLAVVRFINSLRPGIHPAVLLSDKPDFADKGKLLGPSVNKVHNTDYDEHQAKYADDGENEINGYVHKSKPGYAKHEINDPFNNAQANLQDKKHKPLIRMETGKGRVPFHKKRNNKQKTYVRKNRYVLMSANILR